MQVSFIPFLFLRFNIVPYYFVYTCCSYLSVNSLCSVSALCPTVSCIPAAGLFRSIPSARFQHFTLLSHVHLLVTFCPFLLLYFSIVPFLSCTLAAGLFQSIPSALFKHCALLSYAQLLRFPFSPLILLIFIIVPFSLHLLLSF